MNINPEAILERMAASLPKAYHEDLILVGSLAAACHFAAQLKERSLRTKDADFIVQPAGNLKRCVELAEALKREGWTIRNESGFPAGQSPEGPLPHVKLYSAKERDFWIEFQGLPQQDQTADRHDEPVEFDGAWYSVPHFRFMRLVKHEAQASRSGLKYAAPRMMALANLLAHPKVGEAKVTMADGTKGGLRSAKDLGRAIAIARLTPTSELEEWPASWLPALKECFPKTWSTLAANVEAGLNDLLSKPNAMEDAATFTGTLGLLGGQDASPDRLRAIAEQLLAFAVKPFQELAQKG